MPDFLPSRAADLVTWSTNFSTKITAAPTTFGLTAAQATAFAALHTAFATAFQTAQNPDTRSPTNIVAKDQAMASLKANARQLAGIVQKFPATTDEQRSELGLTVPDVDPSPVPVPGSAPGLSVQTVSGRTVRIRLKDTANPDRRGKPAGVSGAAVFSYVGAQPPEDISAWKFEGNTSRTIIDVVFPVTVPPFSRVWLTAFWFNDRKQSGPATSPIDANIGSWVVQVAA